LDERGVRRRPAALPVAHRSPDGTTATHASRGLLPPTKEEKGFGAVAHYPNAGERAQTTFGSEPSWSARVVVQDTVQGRSRKHDPWVKSQAQNRFHNSTMAKPERITQRTVARCRPVARPNVGLTSAEAGVG
jgi:hypothetical protein